VEHIHSKRDRTSPNNHTTDYRNLIAACCGGHGGSFGEKTTLKKIATIPIQPKIISAVAKRRIITKSACRIRKSSIIGLCLERLANSNDDDLEILIDLARTELFHESEGQLRSFFTTTRCFFAEAAEYVLSESSAWV
jgi:hypothetical protein